MNVKQQIVIDQYIVKPTTYLLNFAVQLVGKILRIDHSLDKDFKRIVVCKFKGMGSILQATPLLQALREKFPKAEIIFVTTTANVKILEHIPLVDQVIAIDDNGFFTFLRSCVKNLFKIMRLRPDVYFDLEIYSDFSSLFALLTLSKNRIGFYLRSSSFRTGIYTHMMFFNPRAPISKVYLQMGQLLHCRVDFDLLQISKGKNATEVTKKYIVINPNASDLRIERRWPITHFIQLIERLLEEDEKYEIHLIGSKEEYAYTAQIASAIASERLVNTAGKLTLSELIDEISHADYMISNDTGPMHIAFSTQTPIICLFGPCAPEQYGISKYAHIVYKKAYCSPCVHDFITPPCKGNNSCMKLITVEDVLEKIHDIHHSHVSTEKAPAEFIYALESKILGDFNR
jgi:ADP-heptose:LPS heptosyltransferase